MAASLISCREPHSSPRPGRRRLAPWRDRLNTFTPAGGSSPSTPRASPSAVIASIQRQGHAHIQTDLPAGYAGDHGCGQSPAAGGAGDALAVDGIPLAAALFRGGGQGDPPERRDLLVRHRPKAGWLAPGFLPHGQYVRRPETTTAPPPDPRQDVWTIKTAAPAPLQNFLDGGGPGHRCRFRFSGGLEPQCHFRTRLRAVAKVVPEADQRRRRPGGPGLFPEQALPPPAARPRRTTMARPMRPTGRFPPDRPGDHGQPGRRRRSTNCRRTSAPRPRRSSTDSGPGARDFRTISGGRPSSSLCRTRWCSSRWPTAWMRGMPAWATSSGCDRHRNYVNRKMAAEGNQQ